MAGVGFTDFYDATTARNIAVGGAAPMGLVLTEINYIKANIDTTTAAAGLTLTVVNVTAMTQGTVYYEAWVDPAVYTTDAHKLARLRMEQVIAYFARLGYAISRDRDGSNNRIKWTVKW